MSSLLKLKFWSIQNKPIANPLEWEPALIEVAVEDIDSAQLYLQQKPLELYKKRLKGQWRIVADWPRSNPGYYRLTLNDLEQTLKIIPRKISPEAFECLLQDLESGLPATIALTLQKGGALAGVKILPPHQNTLTTELLRLQRAIEGNEGLVGLKQLLPEIARNPNQIIENNEILVRTEQAHRISPTRLANSLFGHNLNQKGQPQRVFVQCVKHTLDIYENRLLKFYVQQVQSRLKRFQQIAPQALQTESQHLAKVFYRAVQQATFLDEVNLLTHLPHRLTMVLLKVPTYRALLESYLAFQRSTAVSLNTEHLETPLDNLPKLYQLWGTLQVILVLLEVGVELGYQVQSQQLCILNKKGWFVQVLPNGKPAIILSHSKYKTKVKLIPERRYSREQTISFTQRPDIAIEIEKKQEKQVYLFDPKYKLGSSEDKPQKVDIDKMHAYRDAIINQGKRTVKYAAILYPGNFQSYDEGLQALPAQPGNIKQLRETLYQVLKKALLN